MEAHYTTDTDINPAIADVLPCLDAHEQIQRLVRRDTAGLAAVIAWTADHLAECRRQGLEPQAARWVAITVSGASGWRNACRELYFRLQRHDCALAIWRANRLAAGLYL